ncbi:MAG: hypothetical protein FJW99_00600 [Actinobacteria bacterium]|nr:hypothetical protein [Actinomycetota bacterium]
MAMQSIPDLGRPVLRARLALAIIAVTPALAASQSVVPALGPSLGLEPVPNGDLVAGLEGWSQIGPTVTLIGGPIIEAGDNTTVVGPAFTVPPTAQSLPMVLGVPGANAALDIRARPVEGGDDIPLATIIPDRAVRSWDVGVAAIRGRTVRIVIDPVTGLGRRVYVRSIGPPVEVLPGWSVTSGLPVVAARWGRRGLDVQDSPLAATTVPFTPAARTRFVGISVRGAGRITASMRGRSQRATARAGSWTTVRFAVPPGLSGARISFTARPAAGERLMVAGIGAPVAPKKPAPTRQQPR